MLLNRENIAAIADQMYVLWEEAKQAIKPSFQDWCTLLDSKDIGEMNYNWLDDLGAPALWVGERKRQAMKAYTWKVINQPYENTRSLLTEQIRRDRYGQFGTKIRGMYAQGIELWNRLAQQLARDAYSLLCYDGQFMIDSDHPGGPDGLSTWSNLTHAILDYSSLKAGLDHFDMLMMPDGVTPLGVTPKILMVAPGMRITAEELLLSETKPGGAGEKNALRGRLLVKVNHQFRGSEANSRKWQIIGQFEAANLWPYAVQIEMEPKMTTTAYQVAAELGGMGVSEAEFERRELSFGTEQWGTATFTMPELVYGSDGSGVE